MDSYTHKFVVSGMVAASMLKLNIKLLTTDFVRQFVNLKKKSDFDFS